MVAGAIWLRHPRVARINLRVVVNDVLLVDFRAVEKQPFASDLDPVAARGDDAAHVREVRIHRMTKRHDVAARDIFRDAHEHVLAGSNRRLHRFRRDAIHANDVPDGDEVCHLKRQQDAGNDDPDAR